MYLAIIKNDKATITRIKDFSEEPQDVEIKM